MRGNLAADFPGQGDITRVAGAAVGAVIRGDRLQVITVRHDREDAGCVRTIAFEMNVQHQVDRLPAVIPHHPASDSIQAAVEPVIVIAIVLLQADRVMPGAVERVGNCIGNRGSPLCLARIAATGIAMPLHNDHPKGAKRPL